MFPQLKLHHGGVVLLHKGEQVFAEHGFWLVQTVEQS